MSDICNASGDSAGRNQELPLHLRSLVRALPVTRHTPARHRGEDAGLDLQRGVIGRDSRPVAKRSGLGSMQWATLPGCWPG